MSLPEYIMMCGLPGSGKSTLINREITPHWNVLSTDNYIEKVASEQGSTYNDVFEKTIKDAQKNMNDQFENAIKNGYNIIHDQTNLTKKKRISFLNRLPNSYRREINYIMIDKDKPEQINEWVRRLESRKGKQIDSNILVNMIKTFEEPTLDEGWDIIYKCNMFGKILETIHK